MKLQRTFVLMLLIYITERRVRLYVAQKNMQDMLQLKILEHNENLSKIARKEYKKTVSLEIPSEDVEIGLDESKNDLYGLVWDQDTRQMGIQHLCDIKTLLDEENK